MEKSSRRKFCKQAAIAVAAGAVAVAASNPAAAVETRETKTKEILYKETKVWKAYYKSLE
jgi:anaerobic selenocysteine-containing dehydrogenase